MRRALFTTAAALTVGLFGVWAFPFSAARAADDAPAKTEKKEDKPDAADSNQNLVMHTVLFSLRKNTEEEKLTLLQQCQKYLSKQPGVVFFTCGVLSDGAGALNDRDFDVALNIAFSSQSALDNYDKSADHRQFIKEARGNWKKVRVVDSSVEPRFVVKN